MSVFTPLRYPGGKSKLHDLFVLIINNNFSHSVSYAEPYAGGAGLALLLLFNGNVKNIYINDINKSIFAFWHSVLYETDSLIEMIKDVPVTIETWHMQKEIQLHKEDANLLGLGFSTFFLNRTNRSGILKGGVIGGKKQNGDWKLDERFNKPKLIKRIEKIAERKDSINITNMDACDFLDFMDCNKIRNLFYYLDPPYIKKGSGLYEDYYSEEDHRLLAKRIAKLKQKWIVSYDAHNLALEIYKKYNRMTYALNYSAQEIKKGEEFMAFSPKIQVPIQITDAKKEDAMFNISRIRFISSKSRN